MRSYWSGPSIKGGPLVQYDCSYKKEFCLKSSTEIQVWVSSLLACAHNHMNQLLKINVHVYMCVYMYFSYILWSTPTDIHVVFLFKKMSSHLSIFVSFKSGSKLKLGFYSHGLRYNILGLYVLSLGFLTMLFCPRSTLHITHEKSDARQIFLFM